MRSSAWIARRSSHADQPTFGTTNVDFSQASTPGLQQMRSYRETRLSIGQEGVKFATAQRRARCWRSRSACPTPGCAASSRCSRRPRCRATGSTWRPSTCTTHLRHLRLHADRKGQRRGLRIELVPGEPPRLVLEPWNEVIPATAAPFKGEGRPGGPASGAVADSRSSTASSRSRRRSRSTCWGAACRASGSCAPPT